MKNQYSLLTLVLSLTLISCADSSNSTLKPNDNGSGIFGGVEFDGMTEIRRSMVILRHFNLATGQLEATCSGTLIGKNIVLTAAHCAPAPGIDVFVVFSNTASAAEIVKPNAAGLALEFVKHPNYDPRFAINNNDLALLFFHTTDGVPQGFKPRRLPENKSYPVSSFVVAGAGLNTPYGTAGTLRYAYLSANVLTKLEDGIMWFNQKGGKGICDGDSGGPLFIEKNRSLTFVGVTSFSMNAEGKCTGAGFVNIRPHLSWIQKTMAALQDKYR